MTDTHDLKTDPDIFDDMVRGAKLFDIRFDDRGYEVGDYLRLHKTVYSGHEMKEFCKPLLYTGDRAVFEVTVLVRGYGLKSGYVAMGLKVAPV